GGRGHGGRLRRRGRGGTVLPRVRRLQHPVRAAVTGRPGALLRERLPAADGVFVVEAFVPDPARFQSGRVSVAKVELDRVRLDVTVVDPVEQRSESQHVVLEPGGVRLYPVRVRWAFPS